MVTSMRRVSINVDVVVWRVGGGGRQGDVPVNPASLSALTVRKTCSMQGLKQQIRVGRSF